MADFQSDLTVSLPSRERRRATIALSPTGDIQILTGADKLITQMVRSIVNDDNVLAKTVNSKVVTTRMVRALVVNILRSFRSEQLNYVEKSDPDLTGFSIWRKASGSSEDYTRVSGQGVQNTFTDSNLENGTSYSYGLTRIYQGALESKFVDIVDVTPSAFVRNQDPIIANFMTVFPQDRQAMFYVDYNKLHKMSEILNSIQKITVTQDIEDPRKYNVAVVVENLLGQPLNVSSVIRIAVS